VTPEELTLWKCGGPRYLTRDGRLAVLLESNAELTGGRWVHFFQGAVADDRRCEWNLDGTARNRGAGCDLAAAVKREETP
jgi:hypothetical protein